MGTQKGEAFSFLFFFLQIQRLLHCVVLPDSEERKKPRRKLYRILPCHSYNDISLSRKKDSSLSLHPIFFSHATFTPYVHVTVPHVLTNITKIKDIHTHLPFPI
jgi:hypothetical protein